MTLKKSSGNLHENTHHCWVNLPPKKSAHSIRLGKPYLREKHLWLAWADHTNTHTQGNGIVKLQISRTKEIVITA